MLKKLQNEEVVNPPKFDGFVEEVLALTTGDVATQAGHALMRMHQSSRNKSNKKRRRNASANNRIIVVHNTATYSSKVVPTNNVSTNLSTTKS